MWQEGTNFGIFPNEDVFMVLLVKWVFCDWACLVWLSFCVNAYQRLLLFHVYWLGFPLWAAKMKTITKWQQQSRVFCYLVFIQMFSVHIWWFTHQPTSATTFVIIKNVYRLLTIHVPSLIKGKVENDILFQASQLANITMMDGKFIGWVGCAHAICCNDYTLPDWALTIIKSFCA